MMLKRNWAERLRYRCAQDIEEIVAEQQELPDCTVIDTPDGPLVHRENGAKVLGVCHMDWVNVDWRFEAWQGGKVFCPRLDDRLGVFLLLDVLPAAGVHLDVLLTDSEEIGCSTAREFEKPQDCDYNWMVQFDRRGEDVVLYDYEDSKPWRKAIRKSGLNIGRGTFSDISLLTHVGVCAMNLGIGYHHEHSIECHCEVAELVRNLKRFGRFYQKNRDRRFSFTPKPKFKWSAKWNRGAGYRYADTTADDRMIMDDPEVFCDQCGSRMSFWQDVCRYCEQEALENPNHPYCR